METKDFTTDFLNVKLVKIEDYDTVLLDIDYPTGIETKKCKLFRITKSCAQSGYYKNTLSLLTELLIKNDKLKIKILKERRKNRISDNDIIILFSDDKKKNINNELISYNKEEEFRSKILDIIANLRVRSKEK